MKSSTGTRLGNLGSELGGLREQLEAWRRQKRRGSRIPEAIWERAAELAREHGGSRVAGALRLDYYGLRGRVEPVEDIIEAPAFVELALSGPGGSPPVVVEMERADGARLTIRMEGAGDLLGLAEVFLESGS